jgi:hypothetical protein
MSNVSALYLAAHEIGHIAIDPSATGVRSDPDGGWTVLSTEPPLSGDELLNRQCAGVIAEITLRYGVELGGIMARTEEIWHTDIGEDDRFIIDRLSIPMRAAIYARCAPLIHRVLTDIGRVRLTAIGHHLLQMSPGDVLDFHLENVNV